MSVPAYLAYLLRLLCVLLPITVQGWVLIPALLCSIKHSCLQFPGSVAAQQLASTAAPSAAQFVIGKHPLVLRTFYSHFLSIPMFSFGSLVISNFLIPT